MSSGRGAARSRHHLHVVGTAAAPEARFCSYCGVWPEQPWPLSRVCARCGLGLLLSAPADIAPGAGDAFVVVDGSLRVCAVSRAAEKLLGAGEPQLAARPLHELLIPADAEPSGASSLAEHVMRAARGDEPRGAAFVRPAGVFGVRFEARIAPCGPGSAAVLVLR